MHSSIELKTLRDILAAMNEDMALLEKGATGKDSKLVRQVRKLTQERDKLLGTARQQEVRIQKQAGMIERIEDHQKAVVTAKKTTEDAERNTTSHKVRGERGEGGGERSTKMEHTYSICSLHVH